MSMTRQTPMTRVIWTTTADHVTDVSTAQWEAMSEAERDEFLATAELLGSGRAVITREVTSADGGY